MARAPAGRCRERRGHARPHRRSCWGSRRAGCGRRCWSHHREGWRRWAFGGPSFLAPPLQRRGWGGACALPDISRRSDAAHRHCPRPSSEDEGWREVTSPAPPSHPAPDVLPAPLQLGADIVETDPTVGEQSDEVEEQVRCFSRERRLVAAERGDYRLDRFLAELLRHLAAPLGAQAGDIGRTRIAIAAGEDGLFETGQRVGHGAVASRGGVAASMVICARDLSVGGRFGQFSGICEMSGNMLWALSPHSWMAPAADGTGTPSHHAHCAMWSWTAFDAAPLSSELPLDPEGRATLRDLLDQAELIGGDDPTKPKPWRMEAGVFAGSLWAPCFGGPTISVRACSIIFICFLVRQQQGMFLVRCGIAGRRSASMTPGSSSRTSGAEFSACSSAAAH